MISSFKPTPVAQAISLALLLAGSSFVAAQTTPAQTEAEAKKAAEAKKQLEAVQISGIRASLESSLDAKRNASANVDVITAVDVGKMPDKNLADSLQRVVGVAVRTDYDEAEKVSIRGTNPDMTLILFNGHTVSGGDWYLTDQASSSRSTSLSLMPSSVLNAATVYKTSQANIADGGLAGTINVTTRKPLDGKKGISGVVSVGGVYADLPAKTSPQLNASLNWKNEENTFGLMGQAFAEKRYLRRDTASRFAYAPNSGWDVINTATMLGITDASLAGTGLKASDLNGVRLPGAMSTEFVEGVRDRKGGMFSAQLRPTKNTEVGLTGFYSKMSSANFGRATMGGIYSMLAGLSGPGPVSSTATTNVNGTRVYAQIKNPVIVEETTIYGDKLRVLKSADIMYANGTPPQYVGDSEGYYRSGAYASSGFLDLDGKWNVTDKLTLKGLLSTTKGVGHTENDRGLTYTRYGQGVKYAFNAVDEAPSFSWINAGSSTSPTLDSTGAGYKLTARSGVNRYNTIDSEKSIAIDGEYIQDTGVLSSLNFGFRNADHRRQYGLSTVALKAAFSAATGTPDPALAVAYPGDFGQYLGGTFDNAGFYFPKEVLTSYFANLTKQTTPAFERRVANEIDLREIQRSVYMMQNLEGNKWSGNIGVRIVRTQVTSKTPVPLPAGSCLRIEPGKPYVPCAKFPDAIVDAGEGQTYYDGATWVPTNGTIYRKETTTRTFDDFLPSLNLRVELAPKLIGRLGLSQTIGRQNYNLYGATYTSPTCTSAGCTVTGPNPNLKPLNSRNLDLSVAWYYDRRAMLSLSAFSSLIDGYAKTGAVQSGSTVDLLDSTSNTVRTYLINTSTQQKARIRGVELGWEQPIAWGFGVQTNASYAETRVEDGRPMTGASKIAGNAGVYWENDVFSARLVYNYRGSYVSSTTAPAPTSNSQGLSTINGVLMPAAPTIAAPVSNVAFTANYNIMPGVQLAFSATNLTNPVRATYRYSEAEQQKVDASGRQYYLEARYKF